MSLLKTTELSPEREEELRIHLQTKTYVKFKVTTLKKIIRDVNRIRVGEISVKDWFPGLEMISTWNDVLESFAIEEYLTG